MASSLRRSFHRVQVLATAASSHCLSALGHAQTCHVDNKDHPFTLAGGATGSAMALILLCITWRTSRLGWLLTAVAALSASAFAQPAHRRPSSLVSSVMVQPHLLIALTLALSEVLSLSTQSAHSLTFTDGLLSHCAIMLQLFMACRGVPISTRFGILLFSSLGQIPKAVYLATGPASLLALTGSTLGFVCGCALNADVNVLIKMLRQKSALQRADSRLLHVIKGQCGGARALLTEAMRQHDEEAYRQDDHVGESSHALQVQVLEILTQTSDWCYKREVFVQLEDGTYKSELTEASLIDELRAALGPHAKIDSSHRRVMVDTTVLRLLLHEVSTNAAKYSPSQKQISARAKLEQDEAGKEWLQVSVSNSNLPGSPHLSPQECRQVFERGFKKSAPTAANGRSRSSNGLGLSSVKLATMAVGGRAWMEADEQHTTVNLVLVAEKCGEGSEFSPLCGSSPNVIGRSSPGRMMQCPTIHATSSTGSRLSPDVGVTIGSTLRMATPTSRGKVLQPCPLNGSSLVCIGIDDSPTLRRMQNFLFGVCMRADRQRSGSVGASLAEVQAFVDVVMGRKTISLEAASQPPADVAVLDENIDLEDEGVFVKGSDLARELREEGFRGIVCILTAEGEGRNQQLAALPHVDFAFNKSADLRQVADTLLAEHQARVETVRRKSAVPWHTRQSTGADEEQSAPQIPCPIADMKRR